MGREYGFVGNNGQTKLLRYHRESVITNSDVACYQIRVAVAFNILLYLFQLRFTKFGQCVYLPFYANFVGFLRVCPSFVRDFAQWVIVSYSFVSCVWIANL